VDAVADAARRLDLVAGGVSLRVDAVGGGVVHAGKGVSVARGQKPGRRSTRLENQKTFSETY
jgi:hypothetical protein